MSLLSLDNLHETDFSFPLDDLENLNSGLLSLVQYHPEATPAQIEKAELIFHRRWKKSRLEKPRISQDHIRSVSVNDNSKPTVSGDSGINADANANASTSLSRDRQVKEENVESMPNPQPSLVVPPKVAPRPEQDAVSVRESLISAAKDPVYDPVSQVQSPPAVQQVVRPQPAVQINESTSISIAPLITTPQTSINNESEKRVNASPAPAPPQRPIQPPAQPPKQQIARRSRSWSRSRSRSRSRSASLPRSVRSRAQYAYSPPRRRRSSSPPRGYNRGKRLSYDRGPYRRERSPYRRERERSPYGRRDRDRSPYRRDRERGRSRSRSRSPPIPSWRERERREIGRERWIERSRMDDRRNSQIRNPSPLNELPPIHLPPKRDVISSIADENRDADNTAANNDEMRVDEPQSSNIPLLDRLSPPLRPQSPTKEQTHPPTSSNTDGNLIVSTNPRPPSPSTPPRSQKPSTVVSKTVEVKAELSKRSMAEELLDRQLDQTREEKLKSMLLASRKNGFKQVSSQMSKAVEEDKEKNNKVQDTKSGDPAVQKEREREDVVSRDVVVEEDEEDQKLDVTNTSIVSANLATEQDNAKVTNSSALTSGTVSSSALVPQDIVQTLTPIYISQLPSLISIKQIWRFLTRPINNTSNYPFPVAISYTSPTKNTPKGISAFCLAWYESKEQAILAVQLHGQKPLKQNKVTTRTFTSLATEINGRKLLWSQCRKDWKGEGTGPDAIAIRQQQLDSVLPDSKASTSTDNNTNANVKTKVNATVNNSSHAITKIGNAAATAISITKRSDNTHEPSQSQTQAQMQKVALRKITPPLSGQTPLGVRPPLPAKPIIPGPPAPSFVSSMSSHHATSQNQNHGFNIAYASGGALPQRPMNGNGSVIGGNIPTQPKAFASGRGKAPAFSHSGSLLERVGDVKGHEHLFSNQHHHGHGGLLERINGGHGHSAHAQELLARIEPETSFNSSLNGGVGLKRKENEGTGLLERINPPTSKKLRYSW